MKPLSRNFEKCLHFILIFLSLATFFFTIDLSRKKIGESFPGYLTFENNIIGAFYVPGWSGPKEGLIYHSRPKAEKTSQEIFSNRDYLLVVLFPAFSGLLFIILGSGLCLYLPSDAGRFPLLLFHFLVGSYLILSPEFHLTYHSSYFLLSCFAFIPAPMIHFALLFPERARFSEKYPLSYAASYLISGLILIPYLYFFMRDPATWISIEYTVVFYVIGAYLFWLARLIRTLRRPQFEFNRIIARYLLLGQIVAFVVPLLASVAIFIGDISFPLNLATPLTLLFPIALFIGVILGNLRQSQMQLVQSEKRAALGNLLAGLAHEINNPMTFIYSAIEPLREFLQIVRNSTTDPKAITALDDTAQLVAGIEEGATRAKGIVDNFRYFSYPGHSEIQEIDLNEIIEHSLLLLTPKWKDRIQIVRKFGDIPKVKGRLTEIGQVFVNVLSNACDAISAKRSEGGLIEIVTRRFPVGIQVSIRDNGQGISKEVLLRIFDSFYTTKEQGEGTGLGLAITLEIIKKHRGTIDARSEIGRGAEFIINLPIK